MRVVIDTHVFLDKVMPRESQFYKVLLKENFCMVTSPKIENEYTGRAWSRGYRTVGIDIALRELDSKKKRVHKPRTSCNRFTVNNREVQKDAHLIKAALAAHATYIITEEWTHLLRFKDKIQREFGIEVITPCQFLQ